MLECTCKSTGHNIDTEQEATATNRNRKRNQERGSGNRQVRRIDQIRYPPKCRSFIGLDRQIGSSPPAMWNFRPCSRTLHTHTHTHTNDFTGRHLEWAIIWPGNSLSQGPLHVRFKPRGNSPNISAKGAASALCQREW